MLGLGINGVYFFWGSSNYVHIVKSAGDDLFIRFTRVEERGLHTLEAELEFLLYLKQAGYNAAYPLQSKSGRYIVAVEDDNGKYYGLVFEGAPGVSVPIEKRTPVQFMAWGKALGNLHNLSHRYQPGNRPWEYEDYLVRFQGAFREWGETEAIAELNRVRAGLAKLGRTGQNFGLIHYDFQYDNTFWSEEEQKFWVIDFDDAHYHFYALDLVSAMADLDEDGPENKEECLKAFYSGYNQ